MGDVRETLPIEENDFSESKKVEEYNSNKYEPVGIANLDKYEIVPETLRREILSCRFGNDAICEARQFSQNLMDNANIIINVWSFDGTLVNFNNYAEKVTGFKEEEVLGKGWINSIVNEEIHQCVIDFLQEVKENNIPPTHEGELLSKDGSKINVLWTNYLIYDRDKNPTCVVSMGINITESKKSEELIHKLAYYDSLTGLINRTMLKEKLDKFLNQADLEGKKVAILFMDLDDFKSVNDTLGHVIGDELLKNVGEQINITINKNHVASRIGGDEFIIVIPDVKNITEVVSFCEKMMRVFKNAFIVKDRELNITASVGVAIFPEDGRDELTLLKNADIAMYNAKGQGKNRFQLYNDNMNSKIMEKLNLENGLRNALKNKEFKLVYQPQIDIRSGEIIGMEALIRWEHPIMGIIPPVKFIPIAEETGLITSIGEWVLREALRQNKLWQSLGYKYIKMAVNISAKQFEQDNFVDIVMNILEEISISAEFLELEITETIAMKNFQYTISILEKLKKLNINVSLDDFGTGYSSLNYLKELPINTLKIDKSFLNNVTINSNEEIIAKAIINLAQNIGLSVVAEGVETIEQLQFLKIQNCDIAQGYYFSKPISSEECKKWLVYK